MGKPRNISQLSTKLGRKRCYYGLLLKGALAYPRRCLKAMYLPPHVHVPFSQGLYNPLITDDGKEMR